MLLVAKFLFGCKCNAFRTINSVFASIYWGINCGNSLKVILSFVLMLLLPAFLHAQVEPPIKFKYANFSTLLTSLEKEHFHVKKVRRKFDLALKHATIQNNGVALVSNKKYYNDFVEEWSNFIANLKGKAKERFLNFAEKHGLNDEPPF